MKNFVIPPHLLFIIGFLGIIASTLISSTDKTIFSIVLFSGIVFVTIGIAGMGIELLGKKVAVVLKTPVSDFKFSKEVALFFSLSLIAVFIVFLNNPHLIKIPVSAMFLLSLAFNGGVGGQKFSERTPFYISTLGFIFFLLTLLV